jgi:hypothetical protein
MHIVSDVSQTLNRCLTPVSSHCQSISESFIEDTLNENDPADDLMSFCDGASQDDAGEVVNKQCINVLDSQDVEKQTGKSQFFKLNPPNTIIMTSCCNVLLCFGAVIYSLSLIT